MCKLEYLLQISPIEWKMFSEVELFITSCEGGMLVMVFVGDCSNRIFGWHGIVLFLLNCTAPIMAGDPKDMPSRVCSEDSIDIYRNQLSRCLTFNEIVFSVRPEGRLQTPFTRVYSWFYGPYVTDFGLL
jgi:hypothetical protein